MSSSDRDFLKLTSIFVGDLSKFASESDLANLFAPYGPVVDVSIKKNHLTGKTLSYGFVTLASEEMASRAITELDGLIFGGRQLKVRWAMHNVRSQNPMSGGSIVNSLYVKFITPEMNRYVNEEDLHRIFSVHGQVTDISLKDTTINPHTGLQSGYGFVHFLSDSSGMKTAFRAMKALDNCLVGELMFHVEPSRNLMKQFSEMERLEAAATAAGTATGAADRSEAQLSAANVFTAHSPYSAAGMSPRGVDGGNRGGREVSVAGNMSVHGKNTGIVGAGAPGIAIGMHANHYAIPPATSQFYSHDGGGGGGGGVAFSPAGGVGVGSSGNGGLNPNMGGVNPQSSRTMPLGVSTEHYYQMPIAHQHQHQNPRQVQYEAIPSSMLGVISPFPPSAFNTVAGGSVPVSGMVPGMGGNLGVSSMGVTRLGAGAADGDSLFSRHLPQPQFNVPTAMLYPMQHSQHQQQQHQQLTSAAFNWGMQQRISEIGHIFPGMIGCPMQASMGNVNNLSSSINPPPRTQHQHGRGQGPLGLHGQRQQLQLQQSQHQFQQQRYSHIQQQPPQTQLPQQHHFRKQQQQQQRYGLLPYGRETALPAGAGGSGVSVGATTTSGSSVTTSSATPISQTDRYRNTGVGMSMNLSMGRGDVAGAGGGARACAHEGNQHSMLDSDQPPKQWSTAQTQSLQEPSNLIRVYSKSAPHSPAEFGEAQLLADRGGVGAFGEADELTAVSSKTVVSLAPSLLPLVEGSDSRTEVPGGQYWSVDDQQRADDSSFSSSSFSTSCKIISAPEQQGYEVAPSSVDPLTAGVAGDTVRAGEKDESGGCGGSQETEVDQDAVRRSGVTLELERKNSLQLAASNAGTAPEIACGENGASVSADSAMQMLETGFAEKVSVLSDANTDHKDG